MRKRKTTHKFSNLEKASLRAYELRFRLFKGKTVFLHMMRVYGVLRTVILKLLVYLEHAVPTNAQHDGKHSELEER